jgi:hypothetical protein
MAAHTESLAQGAGDGTHIHLAAVSHVLIIPKYDQRRAGEGTLFGRTTEEHNARDS